MQIFIKFCTMRANLQNLDRSVWFMCKILLSLVENNLLVKKNIFIFKGGKKSNALINVH